MVFKLGKLNSSQINSIMILLKKIKKNPYILIKYYVNEI